MENNIRVLKNPLPKGEPLNDCLYEIYDKRWLRKGGYECQWQLERGIDVERHKSPPPTHYSRCITPPTEVLISVSMNFSHRLARVLKVACDDACLRIFKYIQDVLTYVWVCNSCVVVCMHACLLVFDMITEKSASVQIPK